MRLKEENVGSTGTWVELFLLLFGLFVALVSARPYAGSWNDGSRLATVEAIVDHHTLAIDSSIFVQVPGPGDQSRCPYRDGEQGLTRTGTYDKLWIRGHFYSDKSPVPALWLAGWYKVWQLFTGCTARVNPDGFCYLMTLLSSGLAYVVCLICLYRLCHRIPLPDWHRHALVASLALATVALPYVQHVNGHILLLAVTMAIVLQVARLADAALEESARWSCVLILGVLTGLGYTIDLGVGPVFLACTAGLVWYRGRRWFSVPLYMVGALPSLALHHAVNYAIGGTLGPANAITEYLAWPGSPFEDGNITGHWAHAGPGGFAVYAASMLFGKRGFIGHNLPLFLFIPAVVLLLRRRLKETPEVLWAAACCSGSWLLYAATSNNSSGQCCTIRWLLPLLAPAYYVLALLLSHVPDRCKDFLVLSSGGLLLMLLGVNEGPWMKRMIPGFWAVQAVALFGWFACHTRFAASLHRGQHLLSFCLSCKSRVFRARGKGEPAGRKWPTAAKTGSAAEARSAC